MRENAVCRCNQRLTSTRKVFPPVRNMVVSLAWGALRYSLFLPIRPHPLSATGGGCVRIIRPRFARSPVSPVGSVGASACGRGVHRTPAPQGKAYGRHLKKGTGEARPQHFIADEIFLLPLSFSTDFREARKKKPPPFGSDCVHVLFTAVIRIPTGRSISDAPSLFLGRTSAITGTARRTSAVRSSRTANGCAPVPAPRRRTKRSASRSSVSAPRRKSNLPGRHG